MFKKRNKTLIIYLNINLIFYSKIILNFFFYNELIVIFVYLKSIKLLVIFQPD